MRMCGKGGRGEASRLGWQVLADQVLESVSLPKKWWCTLEAGAGGWMALSLRLDFYLSRLHLKQNKDSPKEVTEQTETLLGTR